MRWSWAWSTWDISCMLPPIYLIIHCCSLSTSSHVQHLSTYQPKRWPLQVALLLLLLLECHPLFPSDQLHTNLQDVQADFSTARDRGHSEDWSSTSMPLSSSRADCNFCQSAPAKLRMCRWTELAVRSRPSDQKRQEQPETAVNLFSDSVFLDLSKQAHNTSMYLKHNQAKFKRRIMLP